MDKNKLFNLAILILPWFSVPFIGRKAFFRFMPAAAFISLFLSLFSLFANKRKWWVLIRPLFGVPIDYTYILGTYFVGTIWIFKLTYGKFRKYMATNFIMNLLNAYPFMYLSEKAGAVKFVKMTKTMWFLSAMLMSIGLYAVQSMVEKSMPDYKK